MQIRVKLQKLRVPKFRGDITQSQGFWGQLNTSIQEKCSLSNGENFNYVLTFLTNSAYWLSSGLSLSSENYKEALNILKDRYENRQPYFLIWIVLRYCLLSKIFTIKIIYEMLTTKQKSVSESGYLRIFV